MRSDEDAAVLEDEHVRQVYNVIAPHFSHTRYKPWPVVDKFLRHTVTPFSILADVGCGNGKYLNVRNSPATTTTNNNSNSSSNSTSSSNSSSSSSSANDDVVVLASDRCSAFVDICADGGLAAGGLAVCDNLLLPYRTSSVDFLISVAVLHHFASAQRRIDAFAELLRVLVPGGKLLATVWALRQESGRPVPADGGGDVMVAWHVTARFHDGAPALDHGVARMSGGNREIIYQRYYHLFADGELQQLAVDACARCGYDEQTARAAIDRCEWERDNYFIILTKPRPPQGQQE